MKIINLFKRIFIKAKAYFHPKLAKRHANPYATHLPILIGIAKLFKIKRVLELGSGDFSTPLFLNKTFFPDLENLTSLEDNPEWARRLRERMEPDSRFHLIELDTPISSVVGEIELHKFDLVFVDNSAEEMERANTLLQISARSIPEIIVLIHDYEVVSYQQATDLFANRLTFLAFNPATGIVWNVKSVHKSALWIMDFALKRYKERVPPDDVMQWNRIFEKGLLFMNRG